MVRKTIAVDFDGVIADGHRVDLHKVRLMPGVREALDEFKAMGYDLVVFTCRCNFEGGKEFVEDFLRLHGLDSYFREVTNVKPVAAYYIDDHGVRFHNWRNAVDTVRFLETQR